MKISVISFSRTGAEKNLELAGLLQDKHHQAASFSWHTYTGRRLIPFQSLGRLLTDLWTEQELLLFVTDLERVMREVGPLAFQCGQAAGEAGGPALIAVDEEGQFVIPLQTGRLAGLRDWCAWLAALTGAAHVWTLGQRREKAFSLEDFVHKNGLCVQDPFRIRTVLDGLEKGEPVGIYSDYPIEGVLPEGFVWAGGVGACQRVYRLSCPVPRPEDCREAGQASEDGCRTGMDGFWEQAGQKPRTGISLTDDWEAPHFERECRMFPHNLTAGICAGTADRAEELERRLTRLLTQNHLSRDRLCALYGPPGQDGQAAVCLAEKLKLPLYRRGEEPHIPKEGRVLACESGREQAGLMICEREIRLHF
ncbi:MAG: hypothetical protein Q4C65_00250 [Eubacteriales bacterium]|nr:hypothetical protein [Eubacteriales bacterium]